MKAIYASKLYKSSTRKQKIHAAIDNPVNAELVSQLAKYLDDEYQTPEYLSKGSSQAAQETEAAMPDDLDPGAGDDFLPSDNLVHVPSGGGGDLGPMPDDLPDEDDLFSDEGGGEGAGELDDGDEADIMPEEPVEESTKIMSCTDIDFAGLKSALNLREDTCGVGRIQSKESELWIYYNDDINLNNIMTQVIEYLNAANYTYLEFNRLARSDNAMVFQFTQPHEVEPIEAVNETK